MPQIEINKDVLEEIVKNYPQKLDAYPRNSFERQLKEYLAKCFNIKLT